MRFRTPLSAVRGLGSAKEGTRHFWWQRVTALALVPLVLWFVVSLIAYTGADYATVTQWVQSPFVTILLLLLIIAIFFHAQLGVQVVIEDYVHSEWLKLTALIALKFVLLILGLASAVAVLRVAFGS